MSLQFIECEEVTSAKKKILLVGEVQSGKTNAILNLINEYSSNYDLCIFLGGTTNLLNNQTWDRANDFFSSKSNNKKIECFNIASMHRDNWWGILSNKNIFPVLVTLKAKDQLQTINEVLLDNIPFRNKKVLVIDDESDYASINTSQSETKIHKLISDIYKEIEVGKLISVTATPFANILANEKDPLYPDKIWFLKSNDQYTGSNFFQLNNIYQEVSGLKDEKESWKQSIRDALDFWIISSAKYKLDHPEAKSEFLINIDVKTPSHEDIKKMVQNYLEKIKTYYQGWTEEDQTYLNEITKNEKYQQKKQEIDELIISICRKVLRSDWIFLLNSQLKIDSIDWHSGKFDYSIIIGGYLLSRGVTFRHLITELILNSPEDKALADTMLQRARWFGYRKENDQYKYMKVFMNDKIIQSYREIDYVIDKLWKMQDQEISVIKKTLEKISKDLTYIELTSRKKYGKNL